MYFFNSGNLKCEICERQKNHLILENLHETCICNLINGNKSICWWASLCTNIFFPNIIRFLFITSLKGFQNLLTNEPSLIKFIEEVPETLYLTHLLYINYTKPLVTSDAEDEINEKCKQIILSVKQTK